MPFYFYMYIHKYICSYLFVYVSDEAETYTNNNGNRMTDLMDIFEETTNFNDRTFLLNLPPETLSIINGGTSLPENQSFGAALADVLSDPTKIKFLVRSIQNNSEDTLDFPDKTVILRGATNDATKLTFWYETIPKNGNLDKVLMRESMSVPNNLNWIFNKEIRKEGNENDIEHEDINTMAIEFPKYDGEGTLYFPFFILMMLREFCNSAEYFYTKKPEETKSGFWYQKNTSSSHQQTSSQLLSVSQGRKVSTASSFEVNESAFSSYGQDYLITLYFKVPENFQASSGLKQQAVDVISSLIRDIRDKDREQSDGRFRRPSRRNSLDYVSIIDAYKKTLFTLGIAPGSFNAISRYISDAKVLDPNVFSISLVSSIPNKTNMFSIARD